MIKPFTQENELRQKSVRLAELNAELLLRMDEPEQEKSRERQQENSAGTVGSRTWSVRLKGAGDVPQQARTGGFRTAETSRFYQVCINTGIACQVYVLIPSVFFRRVGHSPTF